MQAVHDGMCDFTILFCDDVTRICLFVTFCNLQLVIECVWIEVPWIQEPAHVTVQVASVGLTVKVSAMHAGGLYTLWSQKKLTTFNILLEWECTYGVCYPIMLAVYITEYSQEIAVLYISVLQCWGRFQSLQIMNSITLGNLNTFYNNYICTYCFVLQTRIEW